MAFATSDDVAARLGRPLSDDEKPRIEAFIEDASAFVEDYCGRDFTRHVNESFTLPGTSEWAVSIPYRYQLGLQITSVDIDGVAVTTWTKVGQSLWCDAGWLGDTITVSGSWGPEAPPAAFKAVVCAEVIRWMSVAPGVILERTGELETQFGQTASSQGLSRDAEKALRKYRRKVGSFSLRRSY
jgi:hypothetical protein